MDRPDPGLAARTLMEDDMKEFALLKDGQFQEIRLLESQPPDAPHKGFTWLEVLRKEGPEEYTGARQETVEGVTKRWWVIATLSPEFRPVPPPEVPESITRRQCALQLLAMGQITPEEALAMTKYGDMPAAIHAIIEANLKDVNARIRAEIDFAAANYYRDNELLGMMGLTSEQLDGFFIAASQI